MVLTTARVKTLSSELRTPKKPAISQAAESCHWMAYLRNSPRVEASSTARNPGEGKESAASKATAVFCLPSIVKSSLIGIMERCGPGKYGK